MASASVKARLNRIGQGVLKPEAGLSALNAVLQGLIAIERTYNHPPVITVNPFSLVAYFNHLQGVPDVYSELAEEAGSQALSLPGAAAAAGRGAAAARDRMASGQAQGMSMDEIRREVNGALVDVLGTTLGPDVPLMAGGLDSLGAVEYVNLVGRRLHLQLPSTLVFDHPTSEAVAAYLATRLAAQGPAPAAAAAPVTATRRRGVRGAGVPTSSAIAAAAPAVVSVMGLVLQSFEGTDGSAASSALAPLVSAPPAADVIMPMPLVRWDIDGTAAASALGPGAAPPVRFGAFMAGVESFDRRAFGVSEGEALAMDPQHRLLLAGAAQLLGSGPGAAAGTGAGGTSSTGAGIGDATGVFVGISWTEYLRLSAQHGQPVSTYTAQGAVLSVACGRWALRIAVECLQPAAAFSDILMNSLYSHTACDCSMQLFL